MSTAALLDGLVDDAALFPPASMPLADALAAHLRHRAAAHAALVGRFLTPVSRVPELGAALPPAAGTDDPVLLGLIADTGPGGLADALVVLDEDPRLVPVLVEAALPRESPDLGAAAAATVEVLPDAECYVELPRVDGWRDALAVLADASCGAKLRTGGADADAFPTERELADFVGACVADETPFKLTAGLHHALRHRDPGTGFEHHGFLNVLLATEAAAHGAEADEVEHVLAERSAETLLARLRGLDETAAVVARSFFVAFGSCSIDEPVADLRDLGLLPAAG